MLIADMVTILGSRMSTSIVAKCNFDVKENALIAVNLSIVAISDLLFESIKSYRCGFPILYM